MRILKRYNYFEMVISRDGEIGVLMSVNDANKKVRSTRLF